MDVRGLTSTELTSTEISNLLKSAQAEKTNDKADYDAINGQIDALMKQQNTAGSDHATLAV